MKPRLLCVATALLIVVIGPSHLAAQSFSCSMGKRAACLDYSDKVVDGSAQCFNSYTCDYNGFMCQSDHNDYVKKAKSLLTTYEGLKNCITIASTVEDAKACNLYY